MWALLALEEFGYKPDVVSGTSAGAIAGSADCAGVDPFKIAEAFMGRVFRDFVNIRIPKAGIFDHEPLLYFIQDMLERKGFEELDIPMYVVTSDLDTRIPWTLLDRMILIP